MSDTSILFFGDVVGRIGRRAVQRHLAILKKDHQIDLVIANGENLAHGKGVTLKTCQEMWDAGVDVLTLGNHLADKTHFRDLVEQFPSTIIRPQNYPPGVPGSGIVIREVRGYKIGVLNLLGRVFMREIPDDPFRGFDAVVAAYPDTLFIVDLHAEATSEKVAFGHYVDGRACAVLGTHTHVQTADARVLPGGTGYMTDVGMVGLKNSSLGVLKEGPIRGFLTQMPQVYELPDSGEVTVNACVVRIDPSTRKCRSIEAISFDTTIEGSIINEL